jgi:ParB-like chromosome segregation protein Spo0J
VMDAATLLNLDTHPVSDAILYDFKTAIRSLDSLPLNEKINTLNEIKIALHEVSPFKGEPVDCVLWIEMDQVTANDYNPNSVAPPEMKLLERSIDADGFTQPIVAWSEEEGHYIVVDGFHRNRVGRECEDIFKRIHGYLPIAAINDATSSRNERIASTIRHNRARGKHKVEAMSDIVVELKRRNWRNERICRELGMEPDEVLRLCQITGLSELFSDQEFSKSWDAEGEVNITDFKELTDDISTYGDETQEFRTVNTSDENRVFHTHDKWECHKAGFYANTKDDMTKGECESAYREFLSDIPRFNDTLDHVITEWKHSCEHYLTNVAMNRIAWLGQAAMCYATGVPAVFRGGFFLLTDEQQSLANDAALVALNKWMKANGRDEVTMNEAYPTRQSDIY